MKYHIKSTTLAARGQARMEWAEREMPVLRLIRQRFQKTKPLKDIRIACCLHVTTETGNLMLALRAGGARITLCASNPLSTQDDVAAALVVRHKIPVFAIKGEDSKTYYRHIHSALDSKPQMTMDDGADVVSLLHKEHPAEAARLIGGTEETTTGVVRLRAMEKDGVLKYPIIAVNDALTKHLFDNRYGTGQSTLDGILRCTNVLFSGKVLVVAGYGWCGRGLASRGRGLGARVVVTEIDPLRALEAVMDGFEVLPMAQAARVGDIFVTVTGDVNVIDAAHFRLFKDGAILANSGHFNSEINIPALHKVAVRHRIVRDFVEEFTMPGGRKIYLLGEGRLINLAAAEGHPASVMDMSFANQAVSAEYMALHGKSLQPKVYPVPEILDKEVARLKLKAMGISIDKLTPEQEKYLTSWQEGT